MSAEVLLGVSILHGLYATLHCCMLLAQRCMAFVSWLSSRAQAHGGPRAKTAADGRTDVLHYLSTWFA